MCPPVVSLAVSATGQALCPLRPHARLQAFGRARLCATPPATLAALLAADTAVWQARLEVLCELGVRDPEGQTIGGFQTGRKAGAGRW